MVPFSLKSTCCTIFRTSSTRFLKPCHAKSSITCTHPRQTNTCQCQDPSPRVQAWSVGISRLSWPRESSLSHQHTAKVNKGESLPKNQICAKNYQPSSKNDWRSLRTPHALTPWIHSWQGRIVRDGNTCPAPKSLWELTLWNHEQATGA